MANVATRIKPDGRLRIYYDESHLIRRGLRLLLKTNLTMKEEMLVIDTYKKIQDEKAGTDKTDNGPNKSKSRKAL